MSIELLDRNHRDAIIDSFENAKQRVRIISPFIQDSMAKYLIDSMGRGIASQLITRFYREDFITSVSSLNALKCLHSAGTKIYAIRDLHAKLYLFDDNIAIIGSANFTGGGFGNNIELSLYIEDENDLIKQLSAFFDQLLTHIQASGNFRVTEAKLEDETIKIQKAIYDRNDTSKPDPECFGAARIKGAPDINSIDEVERILEIHDSYILAVLKFEGAAHRRIDPNSKYKPEYYERLGIYFTASPVKPRSLTSAKTIFLSVISWDKSGAGTPIIVGRAKTMGYEPDNVADYDLLSEHPWTDDYPYYIELYDIETVDTKIINCISLNDLIAEVGYRLYPNTENNPTTPIPSLRNRHFRKTYIAITPYAANRINAMLEYLFNRYGKLSL